MRTAQLFKSLDEAKKESAYMREHGWPFARVVKVDEDYDEDGPHWYIQADRGVVLLEDGYVDSVRA